MATLVECPECGRTNNTFVNPDRCYACGYEWTVEEWRSAGGEKAEGGL